MLNNPLSLTDPTGLDCVYLNGSGDRVESIDSSSDAQTDCGSQRGYWIQGYVPDSSFVSIFSDSGLVSGFGIGAGGLAYSVAGAEGSNTWGAWTQTWGIGAAGTSSAPNKNPCANATLAAAGVTAQQQIATAQSYIMNSAGPFGSLAAYYAAVHTGGQLDIKNQPGPGYHNQIGVDAGNISFGITCPFGAGFCQFAAGLAQTLSGNPNFNGTPATGFDTPSDNAAIRIGQAMRAAGCHE